MAPKKPPLRPVCIVVWTDAVADTGWKLSHEVERAHVCTSLGLVVSDTDEQIVLAGTWSEGADGLETNNRITIPRGWVVSQKKVKL